MRAMLHRMFGRTDWGSTYLGFGSMNTPKEGREVALATLTRALEGGIRFIDTSARICRMGGGYPARN